MDSIFVLFHREISYFLSTRKQGFQTWPDQKTSRDLNPVHNPENPNVKTPKIQWSLQIGEAAIGGMAAGRAACLEFPEIVYKFQARSSSGGRFSICRYFVVADSSNARVQRELEVSWNIEWYIEVAG